MSNKTLKIGVIGDLHFRDQLGYADHLEDRRESERQGVLDQIVDTFKEHDLIVFMGDNLNARNNTSSVIKSFTNFIERFQAEKIVMIAGNHEKFGDGRSAIDFLKHIKRPWHIITTGVHAVPLKSLGIDSDLVFSFIPYSNCTEWNLTNEEASQKILAECKQSDIIFVHHALTHDILKNVTTDTFNEPILDSKEIFKKTDTVVIGHIHEPKIETSGNKTFLRTGSVFTQEVGEHSKSIWTIEVDENKEKKMIEHKLEQRGIYKIVNPALTELDQIPQHSIVKAIITNRSIAVQPLKDAMNAKFDASIIKESYENERKQIDMSNDINDYSTEKMLNLYAEVKKLDPQMLHDGYELIRN